MRSRRRARRAPRCRRHETMRVDCGRRARRQRAKKWAAGAAKFYSSMAGERLLSVGQKLCSREATTRAVVSRHSGGRRQIEMRARASIDERRRACRRRRTATNAGRRASARSPSFVIRRSQIFAAALSLVLRDAAEARLVGAARRTVGGGGERASGRAEAARERRTTSRAVAAVPPPQHQLIMKPTRGRKLGLAVVVASSSKSGACIRENASIVEHHAPHVDRLLA